MDLSKLLGDLYEQEAVDHNRRDERDQPSSSGDQPSPSGQEARRPAAGPEWADEARLDEAFASWRPGPPEGAPAAEREMAEVPPTASFPGLEEALAADRFGMESPAAAVEGHADGLSASSATHADAVPVDIGEARAWTRSDDDVLTRRRSGGLRARLSQLRR
jgi:hypothetical protein